MKSYSIFHLFLIVVLFGCDPNPAKKSVPAPTPDPTVGGEGDGTVGGGGQEPGGEQYENVDSLLDKYYELRLNIRDNFSERLRESDQINYRKAFLRRPAHVGCLAQLPLDDLTIQFEGERLSPRDVLTTDGGQRIETPTEGQSNAESESIPFRVIFDENEALQVSWDETDRSYLVSGSELLVEGAEGKKMIDMDRIRIDMKHWNYFYQKIKQNKANVPAVFKHIFGSSNEIFVDVFSEDSRFLLKRVIMKFRGQVIYDRSGLTHRFESGQGVLPPGFTQGLVWEDVNIRANSAWVAAQRSTLCPN